MNNLKMTTKQIIETHVQTLDHTTICKLIGLLGAITHNEAEGATREQIEQSVYRKIDVTANSEYWLMHQFICYKSKRDEIKKQIVARW